jgi:release factor glutamine methyltransferase
VTPALTLGDVLRRAADHLGKTSETARLDAELLLAHSLGRQRIELYTDFDRPLTEAELDSYRSLVARRAKREPVAYILGEWGFRRLTLTVDERALIPRPETEVLVGHALSRGSGGSRHPASSMSAPGPARSRSRSRTSTRERA